MRRRSETTLQPQSSRATKGPNRLFGSALVLLLIAATLIATPRSSSAATGTAVQAIDNTNRSEVATTYRNSVEANLAIASQWNGSTSGCNAGTSSSSFDAATVETINWFRSMAGLRNITENPGQSIGAQQAALMMDAQNLLSHTPSSNWSCYSRAGAQAAEASNLTLGASGARGILGQIEDAGASNTALGHRRWLLFPRLETVGVGNTPSASAIQVINNFGSRSAESPWVQWPPPGFVPDDMIFNRWSISYSGAANVDLTNARVTVVENGRSLGVNLLAAVDGFGDPTLGFEVPGANPTAVGDTVYRVSITGILVDGRSVTRDYSVTAFDARAAAFTCNGQPATIAGTNGSDTITGTAGNDVIVGLGGADTIVGLAGNDTICAGTGNDSVVGGAGNDRIMGGDGSDTIRSTAGNDIVFGGHGGDIIAGGTGNDILIGGDGADQLIGNLGRDALGGGTGNDACWGETGNTLSAAGDSRFCEFGR